MPDVDPDPQCGERRGLRIATKIGEKRFVEAGERLHGGERRHSAERADLHECFAWQREKAGTTSVIRIGDASARRPIQAAPRGGAQWPLRPPAGNGTNQRVPCASRGCSSVLHHAAKKG